MVLPKKGGKRNYSKANKPLGVVVPLAVAIAAPFEGGSSEFPMAKVEGNVKLTTSNTKKHMEDKKYDGDDEHELDSADDDDDDDQNDSGSERSLDFETLQAEMDNRDLSRKKGFKDHFYDRFTPERIASMRMSFADACKVFVLWGVIAGLALLISAGSSKSPSPVTSSTEAPTYENGDPGCLLCPSGYSVKEPDLLVLTSSFTCKNSLPSCAFQCSSLRVPKVYTCGQVEEFARQSTNRCSTGSCSQWQQSQSQCCIEAIDARTSIESKTAEDDEEKVKATFSSTVNDAIMSF